MEFNNILLAEHLLLFLDSVSIYLPHDAETFMVKLKHLNEAQVSNISASLLQL